MAVMAQSHKVSWVIIVAVSINMVNRKLARIEDSSSTLRIFTEGLFVLLIRFLRSIISFPVPIFTTVQLLVITYFILENFN